MIIYKITNKVNNKSYVGQTTRKLAERLQEHFKPSNKSCLALKAAINYYGKHNFSIELVEKVETLEDLNSREIYWIRHLNTVSPNGYNLELGGGSKGKSSQETIVRQKEAYNLNPELRTLIGEYSKNNWQRKEYRQQISLSRKAMWKNTEYREKISNARKLGWSDPVVRANRIKTFRRKKITAYNNDNTPFISFYSISIAKTYGYNQTGIRKSILKQIKYKSLYWRYHE